MCMCAVCVVRRTEGVPPAAQAYRLVFCVSRPPGAWPPCTPACVRKAPSAHELRRVSHSGHACCCVVLCPLFSSRKQRTQRMQGGRGRQGASASRLRPLLRWADARLISQPRALGQRAVNAGGRAEGRGMRDNSAAQSARGR